MQRYHATNCTSAVNNSALGGSSSRDSGRSDSSSIGNYSLNSRRPPPLTPYKLKCEKDGLNSRLGPPDFHPPTSTSPEENLTKEYVQAGYKETVDGLKEAEEIILTQVHTFSKPVVIKCREAVRKCFRAINESRALKRKAGQVYGLPLSGSLLCKPGFPEQRSCGEETKKKWIESLSQQHKRLRSLADNIPGYRRKTLFEVLIRNNVPLLRATWFIKVTYLNQVRPSSASISSGTPDKTQTSRCEQWTKDVIEYLQHLLDELLSRNNSYPSQQTRDRSPQMLYTGSMQKISPASSSLYGEETSLHFKWWYMVRLLQWHHAEGLLLPNLIVDWVLRLLQEKDVFEILQLLLPIVYGVLESIVLSQTYVQNLVAMAVRFIQEPAPGGSDLVDNSRRAYTLSALTEMVRYLVLAAPDTFVASDCFPLPPSIAACGPNDVSYASKAYENLEKLRSNSAEISTQFQGRGVDSRFEFLSFDYTISTIQRSADDLAKIASAGYPQHNGAKAVQALDKALSDGDIRAVYCYLFEDLCKGAVEETWIAEVSPCLRTSLRWIGAISTSFVCSVFFLIEWATCDFRDFRDGVPKDIKFSGRKDCSQVYLVIQLLKQKNLGGEIAARRGKNSRSNFLGVSKPSGWIDAFESPGPLHDIIVCWIDQHEVHRGGAKRLQLLVFELICSGIFNPVAYVRQLMLSGMIDVIQPAVDHERRKRHHRILKQLPGCFVHDTLEEAQLLEGYRLSEAVRIYSNERRLLLRELLVGKSGYLNNLALSDQKSKKKSTSFRLVDLPRMFDAIGDNEGLRKYTKSSVDIRELKERIADLLQFPVMSCGVTNPVRDEFQSSVKGSSGSVYSKVDQLEATPGCEDCRKAKRSKMDDEKSSCYQGSSLTVSDEEDNWWIKKGLKTLEPSLKVDPIELTKQVPRGRQKMVRKTQSLAQLQAARIEGSQGASTSHVCDSKVSCPHHGPLVDGENHRVVDVFRTSTPVDIVSVGNSLKQLEFVDKRSIAVWLTTVVRQLVEESEKSSVRVGQLNNEERRTTRWKLGADELSSILYLMDLSLDLVLVVKFLLWLLPKANSSPNFAVQGGRNLLIMPRNVENNTCEVGEAILVSSLRRYENILLSADLVPETMTALMARAASLMSSNGKISGSAALVYARYILKRYGSLPNVVEWYSSFKATCEKRLLSELDHTRPGNSEYGIPLGVPAGVDNPDDYLRKKITRPSRVGLTMREGVQRKVEEATQYLRKLMGTGTMKASLAEKNDYGYQVAQQIVVGLMDCIRQTGGAAQEGDPSLVSSAVSAVINSIGISMAKNSDLSVVGNVPSGIGSSNIARYVLQIHITCLCLLKEALGERQSRVFEIALATESSNALSGAFAPGKGSRSQHQLSPESYDSNSNITTNDMPNGTGKIPLSRATKVTAAVSALVIGAITHGVITLERIVGLLRLREYLDFVQFVRRTKSNTNGSGRSVGASKMDSPIEVYVHWFRLLVGNCKTVSEGLVLELVGESSVVAVSRMQRMLPLKLVFPPAYSILAFVLWRPFVSNGNSNSGVHDDTHRFYQSLTMAFHDVIKHLPFRDVCLRDTQGLYELIVADSTDAEFASVLELNGLDMHLKAMAFAPLRARLFLNSLIDCKVPSCGYSHEGVSEAAKNRHQGNGTKLVDKLVSVLDCLQPAKFHWQWVELRLLLNEQALTEKLENHDMPLTDAIRSSCPTSEKPEASENEKNFIQILLTRLLVRPDAVPLFSEVVHLFGRSVEESMLKQAEWFLAGQDVLFGRKTIRQKLIIVGESKGLPTKPQFWKPWGWCNSSSSDPITANKVAGKKRKLEIISMEEGEVIEEGLGSKKFLLPKTLDESPSVGYGITTERAFVKLVLPCIDQSSDESRSTFVNELVRQFSNIEQQLSSVTNRSITNSKHMGTASSGSEVSSSKGSTRKGLRGGSPSLARRNATNATDTVPPPPPPSPAALRSSMSLRLHFLLRLLPVICGEQPFRNTRHALASTIVRLLGSRVVYEDCSSRSDLSKSETPESTIDPSSMADLSSEVLFDRLLFVLHGLLSSHQPSWLKSRSSSNESSKDFTLFDRDAAENLQSELARMQLPDTIRWRIQAAMPTILPSLRCSLSCQPHSVPPTALTLVQTSGSAGLSQRNSPATPKTVTAAAAGQGKLKQTMLSQSQQQEADNTDVVDPWTLLEDGTSSGPSSSNASNSSDMGNLRATCWLKGAVRVRRTDLTYIGSVDDNS